MGDAEPRRGPSRGGLKEAKELKDLQEMFTAARYLSDEWGTYLQMRRKGSLEPRSQVCRSSVDVVSRQAWT